jgi:hypothetical protein
MNSSTSWRLAWKEEMKACRFGSGAGAGNGVKAKTLLLAKLDKEVISKPVELAGICRIEWNCEIEADTAM